MVLMQITPNQVIAGDTLVSLDGYRMTSPTKITEVVEHREDGTLHVKVEQPATWLTSPDRYLRFATIGVEREEPKPKAKRQVTRTINGVKFLSKGDQQWVSEDGKFEVGIDHNYVTECEGPHPVKITADMRRWALSNPHKADRNVLWALRNDKRGYYCEGGVEHSYSMWVAFDVENDRVIFRDEDSFTKVAEAVGNHIATGEYWD